MYTYTFEYRDAYTHGEWRQQSCSADNEREVIEWYGLEKDCEYRNLKKVKNVESEVMHSGANNDIR